MPAVAGDTACLAARTACAGIGTAVAPLVGPSRGAAARLAALGPDGLPLTARLRCAYRQRRLRDAQPQAEQGVLPSAPSYTGLGTASPDPPRDARLARAPDYSAPLRSDSPDPRKQQELRLSAVVGGECSGWSAEERVEEHCEGECEQSLGDALDEWVSRREGLHLPALATTGSSGRRRGSAPGQRPARTHYGHVQQRRRQRSAACGAESQEGRVASSAPGNGSPAMSPATSPGECCEISKTAHMIKTAAAGVGQPGRP